VRAVNLLPGESRHRQAGGLPLGRLGPTHVVLGVLVVVLAYVTVYVLTNNTISQRKTELASLRVQVNQQQAAIARLNSYTQFATLAQQRAETVRQIAASRFNWHGALSDLSKVMPSNATLQSVVATVAPGVSVSSAGGGTAAGAGSNVRGDINAPAFEMKGCAGTQDDVARLISRLRLINDVQRVTLEDSSKSSTTGASSGGGSGACSSSSPTFDLVVFFQALPGAASGAAAGGAPNGPGASASAAASPGSSTPASTGASK
jgi:Tfp pilus assembly protein PilN